MQIYLTWQYPEKAPKPFGFEKDGDQYKKDIGGGKHIFGEGGKDGAKGGVGIGF